MPKFSKVRNRRYVVKEALKRIAIHEAGHAVIFHHFETKLGELSIDPNAVHSLGEVKRGRNMLEGE